MEPLEALEQDFELDSDQDCDLGPIDSDDSDDEFSLDLMQRLQRFGTHLPQTRSSRKKKATEDDFEREVNAELAVSMAAHCRRLVPAAGAAAAAAAAPPPPGTPPRGGADAPTQPPAAGRHGEEQKKQQEYYDDVYFDSDDDSAPEEGAEESAAAAAASAESAQTPTAAAAAAGGPGGGGPALGPAGGRPERRRRRRPVLTDDQLLYDPAMDEADQRWVDRQRQRYLPVQASGDGNLSAKPQKLPHSDAVLNCPACMTMLCLDCQRHELYSNQYRAMFVFNCEVDETQTLRYRLKEPPRRRGRRGGAQEEERPAGGYAQELYNPARCATCKTEVAVYDSDEVYHFFNVIASHA